MRTFAIEFGRCRWGASGGLVPELRLGWVRIWTCEGSIAVVLEKLRTATADALEELGRQQ
jgi:hypothetical protein